MPFIDRPVLAKKKEVFTFKTDRCSKKCPKTSGYLDWAVSAPNRRETDATQIRDPEIPRRHPEVLHDPQRADQAQEPQAPHHQDLLDALLRFFWGAVGWGGSGRGFGCFWRQLGVVGWAGWEGVWGLGLGGGVWEGFGTGF